MEFSLVGCPLLYSYGGSLNLTDFHPFASLISGSIRINFKTFLPISKETSLEGEGALFDNPGGPCSGAMRIRADWSVHPMLLHCSSVKLKRRLPSIWNCLEHFLLSTEITLSPFYLCAMYRCVFQHSYY